MKRHSVFHLFGSLAISLFILVPLCPLLLWGFSAGWAWPKLIPDHYSLRAWRYVFSDSAGTWSALGVSLTVALSVTFMNLLLAFPAARSLARHQVRAQRWIEVLLYAPLVIPTFVFITGMYASFARMGLSDTWLGVTIAHIVPTFPYMLRALTTGFRTLGNAWEAQASMLGAGPIRRELHVVLPFMLPAIAAGSGLSMLVSLSQYIITFIIGGGRVMTLPLRMFPFLGGGDLMVGAVYSLFYIINIILTLGVLDWLLKRFYDKSQTVRI